MLTFTLINVFYLFVYLFIYLFFFFFFYLNKHFKCNNMPFLMKTIRNGYI
jgi:hypothetical protein